MTHRFSVWVYGKTYSAQSKTKVLQRVRQDWKFHLPPCFKIWDNKLSCPVS